MKIHAIQTGSVRIKQAQVRGEGQGLRRRLGVFTDRCWTDWLPTYAWVIDHREGVTALDLADEPFGPFGASRRLTAAGDVVAVATPGHTADHISVMAVDEAITYVLAGDASYTEALMLAGQIDGVSADDRTASATLKAFRRLAAERRTVYLPTHDPESAQRLSRRQLTVECHEHLSRS